MSACRPSRGADRGSATGRDIRPHNRRMCSHPRGVDGRAEYGCSGDRVAGESQAVGATPCGGTTQRVGSGSRSCQQRLGGTMNTQQRAAGHAR